MQKDANTILLFTNQRAAIDYLSDDDAGQLFKAIYAYADEGNMPDFNGPMMSLFTVIRTQIDRSRKAYKAKCERNSANAKRRYATNSIPTVASPGIPSQASECERMPSHADASLPNPTPTPNPKSNPDIDDGADTLIINEAEMAANEECPFDKIWEMYGKPIGDVEQLRTTWATLSANEKRKIIDYVTIYVRVRPDRKYRKNFENFLACRTFFLTF